MQIDQRGSVVLARIKGCVGISPNKWIVCIETDGKSRTIGRFNLENEIEAAKAYDLAAIKIFGQFAKLNFDITSYIKPIKLRKRTIKLGNRFLIK